MFIQKGTLELHNLDHKLPFDTSFGLVGQHLLPSKTDLSAVLRRTAHTITMGAFPVISHYNAYPLSRRKYQKRYPGAKIYACFDMLLVVFGGREASSKLSRSVPCIVRDGTTHHFGGVCALCGAP